MKETTMRKILGLMVFITTIIAINIIPQLILSGKLSMLAGLLVCLPVAIFLSAVIAFGARNTISVRTKSKIFAICTLLLYVFIASVIYIISSRNTSTELFLIIPVDLVIFAFPLYLYFRTMRPASLSGLESSEEYTRKLNALLNIQGINSHTVYISNRPIGRRYVDTSNGKDWKILLKKEAISELSPEETEAAILEAYFARSANVSLKIIFAAAGIIAALVDVLLIMNILAKIVPASDQLAVLIVMAADVVAIPASLLSLSPMLARFQAGVDKKVVKCLASPVPLKSIVIKTSKLMVPLRPLTEKQRVRYFKRVDKMMARRLYYIGSFEADGSM